MAVYWKSPSTNSQLPVQRSIRNPAWWGCTASLVCYPTTKYDHRDRRQSVCARLSQNHPRFEFTQTTISRCPADFVQIFKVQQQQCSDQSDWIALLHVPSWNLGERANYRQSLKANVIFIYDISIYVCKNAGQWSPWGAPVYRKFIQNCLYFIIHVRKGFLWSSNAWCNFVAYAFFGRTYVGRAGRIKVYSKSRYGRASVSSWDHDQLEEWIPAFYSNWFLINSIIIDEIG